MTCYQTSTRTPTHHPRVESCSYPVTTVYSYCDDYRQRCGSTSSRYTKSGSTCIGNWVHVTGRTEWACDGDESKQCATNCQHEDGYQECDSSTYKENGILCPEGQTTGAAAQMPCLNELPNVNNGINIERNEHRMDGNSCPIDIQTSNSINAVKKTLVPYEIPQQIQNITGAAAPFGGCVFPDVPNSHWASCDIDKLAINDIVVGYPDGLFKPNKYISRAEFATMLVKGFNLDCDMNQQAQFNDVPKNNWANAAIAKAVDENLLEGYPNHTFKPDANVTRVEALTTIAKGMTCDIDRCKADEILSKYADGNKVPDWARIPVAKSLQNGALKDSPTPNMILPTKDASRADVASMMQTVRVALGYDTNPKTANSVCPACPIDKNALIEQEEIVKIPTLKLSMIDQLTAKSSHVGQYFRANTLEDVTINGTVVY